MLPITKILPKELLPVGDSILLYENIQSIFNWWIVNIIIVTTPEKESIIKKCLTINDSLKQYSNKILLKMDTIFDHLSIEYIYQTRTWTWWALLSVESLMDGNYIFIMFGDMLIHPDYHIISDMISMYNVYQWPVIGTMMFPESYRWVYGETIVDEYWIISTTTAKSDNQSWLFRMAVWCFILPITVFEDLKINNNSIDSTKELSLMTAINQLCNHTKVYNYTIKQWLYDFGNMRERLAYQAQFYQTY